MADIRINSLPSTATSFNTDDYIAIDGASGGTRKMLAATLPLTDVTLGGSSGPSVKSTLSARAPRQGLVFDGTAGATGTAVTIGTADLTFSQWVRVPSTVSATRGLFLFSPAGSIGATSLLGYVDSDATLNIHITGATSGDRTKQTLSGFVTSYAGKWVNILFTRVGSTWTGYINGVATTFSASTSGTAPTWAGNISGAVVNFGSLGSSGAIYNDAISAINIYNRALSASEVVALYEAGAPAGADYGASGVPASNTSLITGDNSTFASDTGYWAKNNSTIGGGVATLNVSGSTIYRPALLTVGKRYRVTWTVVSGQAYLSDGSSSLSPTRSAGTYTEEFIATAASYFGVIASGGSASVDNITLFPIGLLLAPDAAQAGGGLTWYDTSGNAANITLPASGVSWNVPFGNNIAASGTNQNLTLNASGTGSILLGSNGVARGQIAGVNKNGSTGPASSGTTTNAIWRVSNVSNSLVMDIGLNGAATPYPGYIQVSDYSNLATSYPLSLNPNGGVVLVNTTANSGNGAIQLATHTTSAGGIGFGTDTALFRSAAGALQLESSATAVFEIDGGAGNTRGVVIQAAGTEQAAITVAASGTSLLLSTGSPRTTALTLDSSQNATFAGDIRFSSANAFDIGQTGTRVRAAFIKTLVLTSGAPAAANSTGTAGTVTWDANYLYVCTATDTWKRVAIATW